MAPALLSLLAESLPIYEGLDTDDGPPCLAFPLRIIFMYSASGVLCMLLDGPTYCDVAVVRGTEEALSSRLQSKVKAHNIGLYVLFVYAVGGLCFVVIASSRLSSPSGASVDSLFYYGSRGKFWRGLEFSGTPARVAYADAQSSFVERFGTFEVLWHYGRYPPES